MASLALTHLGDCSQAKWQQRAEHDAPQQIHAHPPYAAHGRHGKERGAECA